MSHSGWSFLPRWREPSTYRGYDIEQHESPTKVSGLKGQEPRRSGEIGRGRYVVGVILLVVGWMLGAPSALLLLIGLGSQLFGLAFPAWILIGLLIGTAGLDWWECHAHKPAWTNGRNPHHLEERCVLDT